MNRVLKASAIFSVFLSCEQLPPNPSTIVENSTISSASTAITFAKNYGGADAEGAKSVVKTSDGGYALLGYFRGSNRMNDFYLVKTDKYGNLIWQKRIGTSSTNEYGNGLRQTSDGGFILIGAENYKAKVIKTDKNGNVQWQTNSGYINSSDGMGIAISSDNGYVGTGYSGSKVTVFKLSSNGTLQWLKQYGLGIESRGLSIERTSDNGFIIAGLALMNEEDADMYLLKVTSSGTMQWQKNWGGPMMDEGKHAIQTSDGGYALVGYKTNDSYNMQVYVIRTDSKGSFKWIKGYFPSENSVGYRIRETSDKGFAIGGAIYSQASLLKINSSGTYQWRKSYDESKLEYTSDLLIASDGYVMAGPVYYSSGSRNEQAALVKTDNSGNLASLVIASD